MAGEKDLRSKIVIAACAVLFILAGARAANRPAAPEAPFPCSVTIAFTGSDGWRAAGRSGSPVWLSRPLLLLRKIIVPGSGGVVRVAGLNREPVAGLEIVTCPGLPWGRLAFLCVTHRG